MRTNVWIICFAYKRIVYKSIVYSENVTNLCSICDSDRKLLDIT